MLHNDLQDERTLGSNGVDLLLIIGRFVSVLSSWQMGEKFNPGGSDSRLWLSSLALFFRVKGQEVNTILDNTL